MAVLTLAGCDQVESARKALAANGSTPTRAEAPEPEAAPEPELAPPLPLGELDGAVHQLESALDLLMADRYGPDGRPMAFPETPPSRLAPPEPFDITALVPRTPPEPIFDGLPPEGTVPADTPGSLLRLWSEGDPEHPVMMSDSVHREVAMLRRDIQRLNHNLESLLHHYVGSLHEENERLRQEIQRMYVMRMQEGRYDSAVPRPNQGVLDSLRDEALVSSLPPMDMPGPGRVTAEPIGQEASGTSPSEAPSTPTLEGSQGVMAMAALGGIQYAIVEEWGRTPEEARSFGDGVSSLKGLILAVPPGLAEEDLEELAYHLRDEYDGFDNINVKVFEGVEAAQRFASSNEVTPGMLVADVTKHAATQRDLILLQRGNELVVLPGPDGTTAAPAESTATPALPELPVTPPVEEEQEAQDAETLDEPPALKQEDDERPLFDDDAPVPILVPAEDYDAAGGS